MNHVRSLAQRLQYAGLVVRRLQGQQGRGTFVGPERRSERVERQHAGRVDRKHRHGLGRITMALEHGRMFGHADEKPSGAWHAWPGKIRGQDEVRGFGRPRGEQHGLCGHPQTPADLRPRPLDELPCLTAFAMHR